ncbi:uncharacterized protein F5Z01DRAFT_673160 [Emericellopsis atlantica]|uniref:Uncharacterized protein n=1 Tax=Emericellopsis atlantica TaxID=2614577 RepID=A0A9P7ZNJ4_9HYPO|nr:uncharacterized protein F5Z01DRAFT_673160 [Emericellopsis atlantica]KAG9255206.1 hypothetical protein F5Z01DRAFT_673160 [Emericellopsis atlantica]
MDTINNVATAASKAVFGGADANKEPVSGAQGDVGRGEPYDAGNLDSESQEKLEKTLSEDKASKEKTDTTTAAAPPTDTTTSDKPATDNDDDGDHPRADPAVPDASAVEDSTKEPEPEPEHVDPKGPSPKPVAQVAREHGGDAGLAHKPTAEDAGDKGETEEKDDNKPQTTGEVVHATGFAAEGGDFDATKPGAGKEAERLTEQGSSPGTAPSGSQATDDASDSKASKGKDGKDKPSLKDRIKAKLNRH